MTEIRVHDVHPLECAGTRPGAARRRLALPAVLLAVAMPLAQAAGTSGADADARPGHAVEEGLAQYVQPRSRNEVMVLGSWHVAAFRDWLEPRHVEDTLAMLERYAPTRIAIEVIPPDEMALLAERAPHDEVARKALERFGRASVPAADAMQEVLGVGRIVAAMRVDALLEGAGRRMDDSARLELLGHMLAAYEFESAALQWSYLPQSAREETRSLPAQVREALDKRLQGSDEVVRLAMPLARKLGIQRLYQVDSQYETLRTLAFPEELIDEVFARAAQMSEAEGTIPRMLEKPETAREQDAGLLGLTLDANTHRTQLDDTTQWIPWLTMAHSSGLDRLRYTMWELRNQRMAANVMDAAASTRPERVLFIVGFSHKSYVERALAPHLGIRLVQPAAFVD